MTSAIPVRVALVDETASLGHLDLEQVAGALSQQIAEDVEPVWHVRATVAHYVEPPPGTWSIRIQEELDEPGALGYHTDKLNQPVSYVKLTDGWPQTVSHELIEMLVDPWGNRLHGGRLPREAIDQWQHFDLPTRAHHVHYLLEACDPPERTSYDVAGVELSDFIHPAWYRTTPGQGLAFSQAGSLTEPREVDEGGYVSFCNDGDEWFQVFVEKGLVEVADLGYFDSGSHDSIREWTDERARVRRSS